MSLVDALYAFLIALRAESFEYECACCGYSGTFRPNGSPIRLNAKCPRCGSLERHRLLAMGLRDLGTLIDGKDVLHFAPEGIVTRLVEPRAKSYVTADITPGRADRVENIEALSFDEGAFDCVLCFHVLEHVNDARALSELYRVLRPGGHLLTLTPIVYGWETTYQDDSVEESDRARHFGQSDHVRWFGRDYEERLESAQFSTSKFVPGGRVTAQNGLIPGETLYISTKAAIEFSTNLQ